MGHPIKPYLSIEQQIDHLKNKEKMTINNVAFAKKVLSRINYYHLSGYWYNLYNNNKEFIPGTTFEQIYKLYQFDCKLRFLITQLLKDLELKFKAHIANYIGEQWGPLGYQGVKHFYDKDAYTNFLSILNKKKKQYKNKPFVHHHINNYDGKFPIWAVIEILSFSDVTKFYKSFYDADRKKLLKKNYKNNWDIIKNATETPIWAVIEILSFSDVTKFYKSFYDADRKKLLKKNYKNNWDIIKNATETPKWIITLCNIRNICAHYERLYNTRLVNSVKLPQKYATYNIKTNKLFAAIIILMLLIDDNQIKSKFITDLKMLFNQYNFINIQQMGFPNNWEDILKL